MASSEDRYASLSPLIRKGQDRQDKLKEIVEGWCTSKGIENDYEGHIKAGGYVIKNVALWDENPDSEHPEGQPIDLGDLLRMVENRLREQGAPEEFQLRNDLYIILRNCRVFHCNAKDLKIRPQFIAYNVKFEQADFRGASFGEGAQFLEATFGELSDFSFASLAGWANFSITMFGERAKFHKATFGENADFSGSKFGKQADFSCVIFGKQVKFQGSTFGERTEFRGGTFGERPDFSGTTFGKQSALNGINLRKALLQNVDLSYSYLNSADLRGADLQAANLENAEVTGVRYNRFGRYRGIRVSTCYGSPLFKRFAQDQDFIEEYRSAWFRKPIYLLWLIFADCGRSFILWFCWSFIMALFFGLVYYHLGHEAFSVQHLDKVAIVDNSNSSNKISFESQGWRFNAELSKNEKPTDSQTGWSIWITMYYSIVTFTTLGFGDVVPKTLHAAGWVTAEVILGYIMLGGLISIMANKLARRSGQ